MLCVKIAKVVLNMKLRSLVIVGWLFLLPSCSLVCIEELTQSPEFIQKTHIKSVLIVGMNDFKIDDISNKYFFQKYPTGIDFIKEYIGVFKNRLNKSEKFTSLSLCSTVERDYSKLECLKDSNKTDLIIKISKFDISNRISEVQSGDYKTPLYILNVQYEVIDTKTEQCILRFNSLGGFTPSLFNYEHTMDKMVDNSINHAVQYLKFGTTKFKKNH